MYKLEIKRRNFATVTKDGKEIEPLSGLLCVGNDEWELRELLRLANIGLSVAKKVDSAKEK